MPEGGKGTFLDSPGAVQQNPGITEPFRLDKTSKIIESNHKHDPALSPLPLKVCWSRRVLSLTTGPGAPEVGQIGRVKPSAPCPRTPSGLGSISGDIPTHSAPPERSKVDESDPENSFPQLLLLAIIILWGNQISSPSFNLTRAKLHVVPSTLGAGGC